MADWKQRSFSHEILIAAGINVTAFWEVANVSDLPDDLFGYPENGGSNFLRNIGTILANCWA
jgi:hypothetical protein